MYYPMLALLWSRKPPVEVEKNSYLLYGGRGFEFSGVLIHVSLILVDWRENSKFCLLFLKERKLFWKVPLHGLSGRSDFRWSNGSFGSANLLQTKRVTWLHRITYFDIDCNCLRTAFISCCVNPVFEPGHKNFLDLYIIRLVLLPLTYWERGKKWVRQLFSETASFEMIFAECC